MSIYKDPSVQKEYELEKAREQARIDLKKELDSKGKKEKYRAVVMKEIFVAAAVFAILYYVYIIAGAVLF